MNNLSDIAHKNWNWEADVVGAGIYISFSVEKGLFICNQFSFRGIWCCCVSASNVPRSAEVFNITKIPRKGSLKIRANLHITLQIKIEAKVIYISNLKYLFPREEGGVQIWDGQLYPSPTPDNENL